MRTEPVLVRPFQHSGKKTTGLPFAKTVYARVRELDAVARNYIAIFCATCHPKPEIGVALQQLRGLLCEYASAAPRSEGIFRAVGKFFLQSVEDVWHKVGRSTPVEQIVLLIEEIDFWDPQTEHCSLVSVHHIQKSPAAMAAIAAMAKFSSRPAGTPNQPAPSAPVPAGSGAAGDAPGAVSAGGGRREKERAKKEKRRQMNAATTAAGATTAPASTPWEAQPCVWFCSTSGCDSAKKRGGKPCSALRHVLPTKEAVRLEILASMARLALTARVDFPTSCPP
jgi:hypothetical protein